MSKSLALTLVLALTLLNMACGKSATTPALVVPALPIAPVAGASNHTMAFQASRDPNNGVDSPASYTVTRSMVVVIPQPSDFSVQQNGSEFYHVSIMIGSVSCDYQNVVNISFLVTASGCTTVSNTVSLNPGDIITVDVSNNQQTNRTSVLGNIILQY